MKTTRFNFLIALMLFAVNSSEARHFIQDENKKQYHEEYSVDQNSLLTIENKFGAINIVNTDQDKVIIDVEVIVEGRSPERAEKMLNDIDVEFTEIGNEIRAVTIFNNSRISSWNNGDREINVNYAVQMPSYLSVNLTNKYGNIMTEDISGRAVIDVGYGNLSVQSLGRGDLKPLNEVTLAYSNGEINNCEWLKLELKYSKIQINEGQALMILSKYSKFFADHISSVVSESKYDKYEIGDINNFVCSAGYTNVKIDRLTNKLKSETKYSDFRIGHINSGFELIDVDTKYGGYKLGIEEGASYKLEGEANYAKIIFPESGMIRDIRDNTEQSVSGYIGDKETDSEVKVQTKYGNVKLNY